MSFNKATLIQSTRKEHQCFGCLKPIEKGSKAINQKGYNDYWYSIYLHKKCDEAISKHRDYLDPWGDGVSEGAILELSSYYGKDMLAE